MLEQIPDLSTISVCGAITAPVVWGAVEAAKTFAKGRVDAADSWEEPWYWNGTLRLGSLLLGGGVGTALLGTLAGSMGQGWPWGTMIGIGSGALCTTIVAVVRSKIKVAV